MNRNPVCWHGLEECKQCLLAKDPNSLNKKVALIILIVVIGALVLLSYNV